MRGRRVWGVLTAVVYCDMRAQSALSGALSDSCMLSNTCSMQLAWMDIKRVWTAFNHPLALQRGVEVIHGCWFDPTPHPAVSTYWPASAY